jgi:acyl transferase domain-containing protein
MTKTVFLFSGEGTHHRESQNRLLKHSTRWTQIEDILRSTLNLDLESLWAREIKRHQCPYSPLLTVISQICLSDIWQKWGYRPDVVIGHSTGELSAAYQAGFYTLEDILILAYRVGEVASRLDGVMLHGRLSDAEIGQLPVNLSSLNFEDNAGKHVTVSGSVDEMDRFLRKHPDFVKMQLPHPWHHPDYRGYVSQLKHLQSARINEGTFVSGVTTTFETDLGEDHWHQWFIKPIDFIQSMDAIKARYNQHHLDIIEIGFHPVLEKCCAIFRDFTYASSMFRGEDDIKWILYQRKKVAQDVFFENLKRRPSHSGRNWTMKHPWLIRDLTLWLFQSCQPCCNPISPLSHRRTFIGIKP